MTYHRARCVHCLGSVSSGNSPVTLVIEGEVGGLFRLAEPIVIRIIQRNLETSLANLKDILEAEAWTGSDGTRDIWPFAFQPPGAW